MCGVKLESTKRKKKNILLLISNLKKYLDVAVVIITINNIIAPFLLIFVAVAIFFSIF